MCNVKVAATNVPLTVGVNALTIFGKNKLGERRVRILNKDLLFVAVGVTLKFHPNMST